MKILLIMLTWGGVSKICFNPVLHEGGGVYHFLGRNSQTVKASYTKLSEFIYLQIPVDLRHF